MTVVQKYNPQWNNHFQSISAQFLPHIEDLVDDVLHVGSTSVEGMSANPVIDIDVIVSDFSVLDKLCSKLKQAGYALDGDKKASDVLKFKHNKTVPHELQVIKKDSLAYKCRLLFKKHLQENLTAFNEFNTLKKKYLNKKLSEEKYLKAEKSLVLSYLAAEGLDTNKLENILI